MSTPALDPSKFPPPIRSGAALGVSPPHEVARSVPDPQPVVPAAPAMTFEAWLSGCGYSAHTIVRYTSDVTRVLQKVPDVTEAALTDYSYSIADSALRAQTRTAWRAFVAYMKGQGTTLPGFQIRNPVVRHRP